MKVSLDGGLTYQEAPNGVRVIYDDMVVGDAENDAELHINCTDEGVIMDAWDMIWDEPQATSSETAQEIVDRLVD